MARQFSIGDALDLDMVFVAPPSTPVAVVTALRVDATEPDGTTPRWSYTSTADPAMFDQVGPNHWTMLFPVAFDKAGVWTVRVAGTSGIICSKKVAIPVLR